MRLNPSHYQGGIRQVKSPDSLLVCQRFLSYSAIVSEFIHHIDAVCLLVWHKMLFQRLRNCFTSSVVLILLIIGVIELVISSSSLHHYQDEDWNNPCGVLLPPLNHHPAQQNNNKKMNEQQSRDHRTAIYFIYLQLMMSHRQTYQWIEEFVIIIITF